MFKAKFYHYTSLLITILSYSVSVHALTLEEYLAQVSDTNESYVSNKLLMEAGFIRGDEGFLVTAPRLYGNVNYLNDGQEPIFSALRGNNTRREDFDVGIKKKFETGTNVKLEYNNNYTDIRNPNPLLVRHNRTWASKPSITLEQPLLKDWLGTQTKALIALKNAQMQSEGHTRKFINQRILTEAKTVYWDLATTRANIKVKRDSISRYQKLFDWANKRTGSGLGSSSDELQAESGLLSQKYELQTLLDYEKTKARLFNALRNVQSDQVPETFESYESIKIKNYAPKNKSLPPAVREDLKASYQGFIASKSQATLAEQELSSSVNLNFQYFPSGREGHYFGAAKEAWQAQNNTLSVGLSFDVPLDFKLKKDLISAYKTEKYAAELAYKRKVFEINNEWQQLANQYDILLNQLELVKQLVNTQNKKLKNEQDMLTKGRSSTFNVLQFEQDYLLTQAQYYNTKNRLLNLISAMQLFENA